MTRCSSHPGLYGESLDFLGKEIVVRSSAGASSTLIAPFPAGTLLGTSGITLYAVTHAFDPADFFVDDVTAPIANTIP